MLFMYHSSLMEALKAAYPEFSWQSTKFVDENQRAPRGFFTDAKHQREYLEKLGAKVGVKKVTPFFLSCFLSFLFLSFSISSWFLSFCFFL